MKPEKRKDWKPVAALAKAKTRVSKVRAGRMTRGVEVNVWCGGPLDL